MLSYSLSHGPDDVDPSHVLELPGYDASAASREVTGAGKQSTHAGLLPVHTEAS